MRNLYALLVAALFVIATASSVMACPFNDASAGSDGTQQTASNTQSGS